MSLFTKTDLQLPVGILNTVGYYIEYGSTPNSFLCAVINNDLQAAINEASVEDLDLIKPLLRYLHNHAPDACYGYGEAVSNWCKRKRGKKC